MFVFIKVLYSFLLIEISSSKFKAFKIKEKTSIFEKRKKGFTIQSSEKEKMSLIIFKGFAIRKRAK
jgi:hypothetical protein